MSDTATRLHTEAQGRRCSCAPWESVTHTRLNPERVAQCPVNSLPYLKPRQVREMKDLKKIMIVVGGVVIPTTRVHHAEFATFLPWSHPACRIILPVEKYIVSKYSNCDQ
jgi:hypothetical protein